MSRHRIIEAPIKMGINELTIYLALGYLSTIGNENVVIRTLESFIPRMAEINGHRHCLGLEPFKFEPVLKEEYRSAYWWEVESDNGVCWSDPGD